MGSENLERSRVSEVLPGERVANIVEQCFEVCPLELREHLVDSNVVLTLAGLKPQTEFFVAVDDEQAEERLRSEVEQLNSSLDRLKPEVQFRIAAKPPADQSNKKTRISVYNLNGYERASRVTTIPGIIPFEKRNGWEEWGKWRRSMKESCNALPEDEKRIRVSLLQGFEKGYPDIANYDFADWMKSGKKSIDLQYAPIPFMGLYDEAEPAYYFKPEHANDPSIKANITEAGKILADFYGSDFHKKREAQLASHRSRWTFDQNGRRTMQR